MKQVLFAVACLAPSTVRAQDVTAAKAYVDSARIGVRRFCKTLKPPTYICPVDTLFLAKASKKLTPPTDTSLRNFITRLTGAPKEPELTPSSFAFYEYNFKVYGDTLWAQFGPKWDGGNTTACYDLATTYYVWYARTGNPVFLDRANALVTDYRDRYLIPSGYNPVAHYSCLESLVIHWRATGDTVSRNSVQIVNRAHMLGWWPKIDQVGHPDLDNRIQTRVIHAMWMDEQTTGTKYNSTINYPTGEFANHSIDSLVPRVLRMQNDSGPWNMASSCGGSMNYMEGQLTDLLIRLHDLRPAAYNPAIETAVKKMATYWWTTQWHPADKSFAYVSLVCDKTGSPTSAPDLNGFLLPTFGWLGKTTKDPIWFARGDSVRMGMQSASLYLLKQFTESYTISFRDLTYRIP